MGTLLPDDHSRPDFNCPYREDFGYTKAKLTEISANIQKILDRLENSDQRVDKLEAWRDRLIGGWAIVILILIPLITAVLNKF